MTCGCRTPAVRMRHTVVIQKPSTSATPDSGGHIDMSSDSNWQDVGSWRVRFLTKGGREGRVFDQIQADGVMIVEGHSSTKSRSIIPKWRLKLGTRKLNITAAYDVDEAREYVRCEVTEAR